MIKLTCTDGTSEVIKTYPLVNTKLCIECPPVGSNCFDQKRVDAVAIGDRVCHYAGQPGPSLEVTNAEVI